MCKDWITSTILKRVKKLLNMQEAEIAYNDVKIILESFGFEETTQQRGSHRVYVLKDKRGGVIYKSEQITVPTKKGRKIKRYYVKRIIKELCLEEWYEKNKRK